MSLEVRSVGGNLLCTVALTADLKVQSLKAQIEAEAGIPKKEQALHIGTSRLKGDVAVSNFLASDADTDVGSIEVLLVRQEFQAPDWYPEGKYVYAGKDVLKIEIKSYRADYDYWDSSTVCFVDGSTECERTSKFWDPPDLLKLHQSLSKQLGFETFHNSTCMYGGMIQTDDYQSYPPEDPYCEKIASSAAWRKLKQ